MRSLCEILKEELNVETCQTFLQIEQAEKMAEEMEKQAAANGTRPVMTKFSIYNLSRNNSFDYSKAINELGYTTRSYKETLHDQIQWLKEQKLI